MVGGGNSAGQAALFLADHAEEVTLVIRSNLGKEMSRYLADQLKRHPTVEILEHTEVRELIGDEALRAVTVEDNHTGARRTLTARALFVFIGAKPNVGWLEDQIALDKHGFVLTGEAAARHRANRPSRPNGRAPSPLETSRPGMFAAGDVRSGSIKRVAAAVGEGSMAVRLVHEHLAGLGVPLSRWRCPT